MIIHVDVYEIWHLWTHDTRNMYEIQYWSIDKHFHKYSSTPVHFLELYNHNGSQEFNVKMHPKNANIIQIASFPSTHLWQYCQYSLFRFLLNIRHCQILLLPMMARGSVSSNTECQSCQARRWRLRQLLKHQLVHLHLSYFYL